MAIFVCYVIGLDRFMTLTFPLGQEIFRLEVFPRTELTLEAVDNSLSDISHFRYEEVDSKTVAIKIAKSLDDLVDRGGNEDNAFVLSDPIEGILVVNKPLDFDKGVREFKLEIQASDHGSPQSLSTITTMTIRVKDADDQNPVFTQETYKTSVTESPIITGAQIRQKLNIDPPIHAYDQDIGINTPVRYKIILGNDHGFFELEEQIGDLYLVKEVDLESLPNPVLNLQ
ncbi:cadherin-89D-like, partial [Limulus polyphemus]|uniref:Cadherin-89D-like n=1 Tax=Limulus polyphemus TaxID=6850 RepID=A0ABM1RV76_LIMPO